MNYTTGFGVANSCVCSQGTLAVAMKNCSFEANGSVTECIPPATSISTGVEMDRFPNRRYHLHGSLIELQMVSMRINDRKKQRPETVFCLWTELI